MHPIEHLAQHLAIDPGRIVALDGSAGSNRSPGASHIHARNDYEAVRVWLHEYRDKNTTFRAYQKEAERLLLWCVGQREKPLSSLDKDDFEAYAQFLQDPKPKDKWCAKTKGKATRRHTSDWRPFVGPLSPSAASTALAILDSMMTYLVEAQYLRFNPLTLIKRKVSHARKMDWYQLNGVERILSDEEWQAMLDALAHMPSDTKHAADEKARLRFLVAMLFLLALRIQELEKHTWSSFRLIQGEWWFLLVGKGDKPAKIPVNEALLSEVKRFRLHMGWHELPEQDARPLIPSWQHDRGLGARHMSNLLKDLAASAATRFEPDSDSSKRLQRFSPHWLRHLSASMQDRLGMPFTHIKANLRHASDDTTRRYLHAHEKERHEHLNRLGLAFWPG